MMTNKLDGPSMCIVPFIHLHTWPAGQVFPCCVAASEPIGDMNENTLEEIFNGEKIKTFRKQMVDGQQPAACYKCFQQEAQGIISYRQTNNSKHHHHEHLIDKAIKNNYEVEDFNLYYWDFRTSNLCNMSCRTCGLHLSSKWHEDHKKIYGETSFTKQANKKGVIQFDDSQLAQVKSIIDKDINEVEHAYFAGGEPLINDMHYYILEKLIKAKRFDCQISYNTNLSTLHYKNYDLLEMWSNWSKKNPVLIRVSLDAIGPRAEYIRHGTKWSKIEENLKKLLQIPYIKVITTPVISIFNVMHLPECLDYFIEYHKMSSEDIPLDNILEAPVYYHIASLPRHMKIKTYDLFTAYLEKKINTWSQHTLNDIADKFNSILHYMDADIEELLATKLEIDTENEDFLKISKQNFIEVTNKLDNIRGEDFNKTFPELNELKVKWEN